jgi:GcrA cell cycle regulator
MHGTLDFPQWTDTRIAELQGYIESKYSASRAAIELGITRNAAIGKAHRLGLHFHSESIRCNKFRNKQKPIAKAVPTVWKAIKLPPPPKPAPEPNALRISFEALSVGTCRWPVGEYPYAYCGHPPVESKPYCEGHCLKAYMPPQARNRDPRQPR